MLGRVYISFKHKWGYRTILKKKKRRIRKDTG